MKNKTWYNKIGFFENPFSIKPKFTGTLFGYDKEIKEIFKHINKKRQAIKLPKLTEDLQG